MPYCKTIRRRDWFVDKLSLGEVAIFCGHGDPKSLRQFDDIGSRNDAGTRVYTVEDACRIFKRVNGRLPFGSEASHLLYQMGMEEDDDRKGYVLKLYARRVLGNKDINDLDLI